MTDEIRTDVIDLGDYSDVPLAHVTGWFMCDGCSHLHLILKDDKGVPFAGATFDEEMLVDMLATLRGGPAQ